MPKGCFFFFKLLLGFTFISLLGCQNNDRVLIAQAAVHEKGDALKVIKNAVVLVSDSGKTSSYLEMPRVQVYERDDTSITIADQGVHILFYNKKGENVSKVTADTGRLFTNEDIEVVQNVMIKTRDSATVTTQYMKWSESEKIIRSTHYVQIVKPNETIVGTGFESDQEIVYYRIFDVKGRIKAQEGDDY